MFIVHVHCSCSLFIIIVYFHSSCSLFMFIIHVNCSCSLFMFIVHVHSSCSLFMFIVHDIVNVHCSCSMFMILLMFNVHDIVNVQCSWYCSCSLFMILLCNALFPVLSLVPMCFSPVLQIFLSTISVQSLSGVEILRCRWQNWMKRRHAWQLSLVAAALLWPAVSCS